jgi:hypothetical protein
MTELPYIDTHTIAIGAPPEAVWAAVARVMGVGGHDGVGGRNVLARALGCVDDSGFHVARDERPERMALQGQHRFSRYELRFVLEPGGVLRAETRAAFPGARGAVYRTLVIRSRAHVVATRWLLAMIKRSATGRAVQPA